MGLYLTGYEAPLPSAAAALLPPPNTEAPVIGPRSVLQVSPAPGRRGESRPVGLEELESNDVMIGLFSSVLVAQLRLFSSLLPTALGTIIGTDDFKPCNLSALREIVLQGSTLLQGLTFHDARTTRGTASASLGAPPVGSEAMDEESTERDLVVSQECEDRLLRDPPANTSATSSDTDL